MIGMRMHSPSTNITGTIDAQSVTADGKAIVRIADHWLFADGLEAA